MVMCFGRVRSLETTCPALRRTPYKSRKLKDSADVLLVGIAVSRGAARSENLFQA